MSTSPARPASDLSARAACEDIRDGLRLMADGFHKLSLAEMPGPSPRLTVAPREPEVLLTIPQAQELLGGCSRRHVERLVDGKACRRRAGRLVLIERAGLLSLLRRG